MKRRPDQHGNVKAREGCDRCHCGCKYWENDKCHSCGADWTPEAIESEQWVATDYTLERAYARAARGEIV